MSSTMITVCIHSATFSSCAAIDAIISVGRPTFQCNLYFLLANVACQCGSAKCQVLFWKVLSNHIPVHSKAFQKKWQIVMTVHISK